MEINILIVKYFVLSIFTTSRNTLVGIMKFIYIHATL